MATEIKLWEVADGKLQKVEQGEFAVGHAEKDLEDWIAETPDLLGEDLLVIDRQRNLPNVGVLDLLALDRDGKLVIIELKRNHTPREAVAQALHYASWLDTATDETIRTFAEEYLKRDLADAFEERFGVPMPTLVCQNHRIILISPKLDAAAEGIVNYLAERYRVGINAVFFTYAKVGNNEILARALLVAEEIVQARKGKDGRPTEEELLQLASERGILQLVEVCRRVGPDWFSGVPSRVYGGSFRFWAEGPNGKSRVVFGINIGGQYAHPPLGELDVWIPVGSLAEVTEHEESSIRKTIEDKFTIGKRTALDYVVRLKTSKDAEALVSELNAWASGENA